MPLVSPAVGSALVGGGGPAASHGIICPHCTQETQATIVQCVRSMTSCLLDAVGKNGNVFFLNENASKFVPVGSVCNFPAVVQWYCGTSTLLPLLVDLRSSKVWGRH